MIPGRTPRQAFFNNPNPRTLTYPVVFKLGEDHTQVRAFE